MKRLLCLLGFLLVVPAAAAAPTLSVTVAVPVRQSVPQGAQRVPILTLLLAAPCGADRTVSSLTLRHAGLGAASDILRVYAMDGLKRISRTRSVPQRDPLVLRLSSVVVPSCGERTVSLFADFSRTAASGGEHRFSLTAVDAGGDATITEAPASATMPALNVTPHAGQPSVTAEMKPVLTSVSYGADRIVARLLLTGGKTADQRILAVTFTNDGSARNTDLRNLYLETASRTRLSIAAPQMDGKTVRLTLDPPLALGRNEVKLLQLRADVRASRTRTIQWTVEEPSDVEAEEE